MNKRSTNGTLCTGLDSKSICAIIDACARGGVAHLKMGDIDIRFSPAAEDIAPVTSLWTPQDSGELKLKDVYQASQASGQRLDQTNNSFDQELLDDLRASQLMIDDPHGFEREVINAHLRGEA